MNCIWILFLLQSFMFWVILARIKCLFLDSIISSKFMPIWILFFLAILARTWLSPEFLCFWKSFRFSRFIRRICMGSFSKTFLFSSSSSLVKIIGGFASFASSFSLLKSVFVRIAMFLFSILRFNNFYIWFF